MVTIPYPTQQLDFSAFQKNREVIETLKYIEL